jgi:NAD(P)-dependent dehydrogenase (short-subunit alcohol dehydrogenase family)
VKDFAGKTALITGAGSGFGREFARIAAGLGMKLVLADIQQNALEETVALLPDAEILARRTDVAKAADMEALADAAYARFGAVHLLFNNAGVLSGGLIWESTQADWDWVLGVNVGSVIHGIRLFVPRMLAQGDACHIVNTASVAGLLNAPLLGAYNASKHAVVSLSETLFHDLRVSGAKIGVTVLCPAFVPTGIAAAGRNRPDAGTELTESQQRSAAQVQKAVESGRLTAAQVAERTFAAIREGQFYCLTHPKILGSVELRFADILAQRNPSDPYALKPSVKP